MKLARCGLVFWLMSGAAMAQDRQPSHCIALTENTHGLEYIEPVSLTDVSGDTVRIHYISHSSFLIRTDGGLNIVTDFNGFTGTAPLIPDIVTMNRAHETHWTVAPDPAIPLVLPGWGPLGDWT